jgi:hypothetical protein
MSDKEDINYMDFLTTGVKMLAEMKKRPGCPDFIREITLVRVCSLAGKE